MSVDLSWLFENLGEDAEFKNEVKINEGGGFVSSITAKWSCGLMYQMWVSEDTGLTDFDALGLAYDYKNGFPSGAFYYWFAKNYEQAQLAKQTVGSKRNPSQVWRIEAQMDTIKGWNGEKAPEEVFEYGINYDVRVNGISSEYRADLHLIVLPSAVQAMAVAAGVIKEPVYDYGPFIRAMNDVNGKIKQDDGESTEQYNKRFLAEEFRIGELAKQYVGYDRDWRDSELWQARVKIWAALGEEDAEKYTTDGVSKSSTESRVLAGMLQLFYQPQAHPWAKVARVIAPAVQKSGSTKKYRDQLPVFLNIYRTEADAEATTEEAGGEQMPAQWRTSTEDQLIEFLKDYLTEKKLTGKPLAVIRQTLQKNGFEEKAAMTVDEAMPWIEKKVLG